MKKLLFNGFLLSSFAALLVACSDETDAPADGEAQGNTNSSGDAISAIQDRGELILGAGDQLPGFGYVGSDGEFVGFDIEFGKVMAAAILGDAEKIEFRPLSAQERFTALQTGEVDILIRNTTWTLNRDVEIGLNFGPTTFYDGQGMMAPSDSGIESLEDLEGARIGVEQGTTTELNLADQMSKRGIDFETVTFSDQDSLIAAYESGTIDAWTTDQSALVSRMDTLQDPEGHVILNEVMSKEPLGPAVLDGDDQFYEVMYWATNATIQAEEFGITSENVDDFLDTEDPDIARFLGVEENLGEQLGLENDYAYQIIKQVGNYAEIYDRNLGADSPFNLDRGLNALYLDGGLLYSPPFR
ncbi:amino acid ABC transporter substrate-binding protein [Alkalicoccobacillus murimartini]|uniref:General L-amino acid transport system substrate-binding protein n=1 Tax=Alkalicoccobacillus murimartini TaxID=171685 RepID=A0ABT9YK07_9BACI|nr:amino acid ABC transporter substrate-binding protein [Alkalicoccobacillus murimartini]MDQ0208061.1 general L-amino acid transport system substrate-binding protein [Alkalicoccobacillus murimartini]